MNHEEFLLYVTDQFDDIESSIRTTSELALVRAERLKQFMDGYMTAYLENTRKRADALSLYHAFDTQTLLKR